MKDGVRQKLLSVTLCPACEGDLSDYTLLQKLVLGLSDPVLKK